MITQKQAMQAAAAFHVLRFYRNDETGIIDATVAALLMRMVSDMTQLQWLVNTMIDRVGDWRGPVELRGVFCTKYKPADGIEMGCVETPGFRPLDQEHRYIENANEQKAKEISAPDKQLRKFLNPDKTGIQ